MRSFKEIQRRKKLIIAEKMIIFDHIFTKRVNIKTNNMLNKFDLEIRESDKHLQGQRKT